MDIKYVIVLVLAIAAIAKAAEYTVGDDMGWMVPPTPDYYTKWAAEYHFVVNDALEFKFQEGMHDITLLTKEDFDACNVSNPLFQIVEPGAVGVEVPDVPFYFTCSKGQHCAMGQKFAVTFASAPWPPTPSPTAATESAAVEQSSETRPFTFVSKKNSKGIRKVKLA